MLRIAKSYRPSLKTALLFIIVACIILYAQVKWNNPLMKKTKIVEESSENEGLNKSPIKLEETGRKSLKGEKSNDSPMKLEEAGRKSSKGEKSNDSPMKLEEAGRKSSKGEKLNDSPMKLEDAGKKSSKGEESNDSLKEKEEDLQKKSKLPKSVYSSRDLPEIMNKFTVKDISCSKLFNKDTKEQDKALRMTSYATLPQNRFGNIHCENYVKERGYITIPMTSEENNFPIAYSIIVYKDLGQVERLFRAIYRPQNAYCFHADTKSSMEFREGLKRIVSCFPNAIMSSRSVDVQWGRWTNLECDLICMEDLLKRFPKWKYLINLTGQEFPLHTNLELVRILKVFNGTNSMLARPIHSNRIPSTKLSFPVKWIMGSVHVVAQRGFIDFMFRNKKAIQITNLLRNMPHPDETLFGTLNHNPQLGAPGANLGYARDNTQERFINRVKHGMIDEPCESGYYFRWNCIFGIKDLPYLGRQPELFVNKVFWNFQPLTYDCLEERIFNISWRDYFGIKPPLDLEVYRNLDIVKNHL